MAAFGSRAESTVSLLNEGCRRRFPTGEARSERGRDNGEIKGDVALKKTKTSNDRSAPPGRYAAIHFLLFSSFSLSDLEEVHQYLEDLYFFKERQEALVLKIIKSEKTLVRY